MKFLFPWTCKKYSAHKNKKRTECGLKLLRHKWDSYLERTLPNELSIGSQVKIAPTKFYRKCCFFR